MAREEADEVVIAGGIEGVIGWSVVFRVADEVGDVALFISILFNFSYAMSSCSEIEHCPQENKRLQIKNLYKLVQIK